MRKYVDLRLMACQNCEIRSELIRKARILGYKRIATPISENCTEKDRENLHQLCKDTGLEFISRIDLTPSNTNELINSLRRLRRKYEIIAVNCQSKKIARQAAKDRRVDLLHFPPDPRKRFFDEAEAELASKSLSALEIEMTPIIALSGRARVNLISKVREELELAEKFQIPVVISSGAGHPLLLRGPREYIAIAESLLDLEREKAQDAISTTPNTIIERNREKLSPNFVAPGIKIVRRGRNCQEESAEDTY